MRHKLRAAKNHLIAQSFQTIKQRNFEIFDKNTSSFVLVCTTYVSRAFVITPWLLNWIRVKKFNSPLYNLRLLLCCQLFLWVKIKISSAFSNACLLLIDKDRHESTVHIGIFLFVEFYVLMNWSCKIWLCFFE